MVVQPPVSYAIALFPGFQALDAFGPLDVLNTVSRENHITLAVLAESLEPVTTHLGEKLSVSPFAESIAPTHTFENAPEDIEVLLIPGGGGTRDAAKIAPVEAYIKKVFPKLRYVITVCTGSVVLARTGLLDGRRATTNKRSWTWATSQRTSVEWVPKARWVVDEPEGKTPVWSSSGVSAGLDVTFAFVKMIYGEAIAASVARILEYEVHTDADWDPFAVQLD